MLYNFDHSRYNRKEIKSTRFLLKQYLSIKGEEVEKFYDIEVPDNLSKLNAEDFHLFALSLQPRVYLKITETINEGTNAVLFENLNRYLFACGELIAPSATKVDEWFKCRSFGDYLPKQAEDNGENQG